MYDKTKFLMECNTIFRLIFVPCTCLLVIGIVKETVKLKWVRDLQTQTQSFKMCVHWNFNNNTDINYANAASSRGAIEDCYLAFLPSSTV